MIIKFKLEKIDNFGLKFQILEQSDIISNQGYGKRTLVSSDIFGNKFSICSFNEPQLKMDTIYLRGTRISKDNNISCYYFSSEKERELYLTIFIDLFKELSEKYDQV